MNHAYQKYHFMLDSFFFSFPLFLFLSSFFFSLFLLFSLSILSFYFICTVESISSKDEIRKKYFRRKEHETQKDVKQAPHSLTSRNLLPLSFSFFLFLSFFPLSLFLSFSLPFIYLPLILFELVFFSFRRSSPLIF